MEIHGKTYGGGLLKIQKYDLENIKFPDVNSIDIVDKQRLIKYANELVLKNEKSIIEEITKIISKYIDLTYDEICKKELELRNELMLLRLRRKIGQLEKTHRFSEIRRVIARLIGIKRAKNED
jgi:ribosomal protein L29